MLEGTHICVLQCLAPNRGLAPRSGSNSEGASSIQRTLVHFHDLNSSIMNHTISMLHVSAVMENPIIIRNSRISITFFFDGMVS